MFLLCITIPCGAQENATATIEGRNDVQWQLTGILHASKGEFDLAIDAMNKAVQLVPKSAGVYNNRGRVYYQSGNFSKAMEDFNKSIEIDDKAPMVYNNRADVHYAKREYSQALTDYNKAFELEQKLVREHFRAMFGQARSLDGLNQKKQAVKTYQEFLKIAPADDPDRATAQQRIKALK